MEEMTDVDVVDERGDMKIREMDIVEKEEMMNDDYKMVDDFDEDDYIPSGTKIFMRSKCWIRRGRYKKYEEGIICGSPKLFCGRLLYPVWFIRERKMWRIDVAEIALNLDELHSIEKRFKMNYLQDMKLQNCKL